VTDRRLAAGETPAVLAGDVCDVFGDYNGATATLAGVTLPVGLPSAGSTCPQSAPEVGTIISPAALAAGSPTGGLADPVAPGEAAPQTPFGRTAGAAVRRVQPCVSPRGAIDAHGAGALRIGDSAGAARRRLGRSGQSHGGTTAWCVQAGGTLSAVFSRGRARLVAITASGYQGARGAGPGDPLSRARRAYPRAKSLKSGFYVNSGATRLIFAASRGRIAYVAVADRRLGKAALLRYLRAAGVGR
jgi:hypothetical protein